VIGQKRTTNLSIIFILTDGFTQRYYAAAIISFARAGCASDHVNMAQSNV
jgi:hypothetical protein